MNQTYVGKIQEIKSIEGADRIESAIVVCGPGGKWQGCVLKGEFQVGDLCFVFLQDSILPEIPEFEHMRKHKFRVKMCRFLKTPSEVLITKPYIDGDVFVGAELSELLGVTKYEKPLDISLQGDTRGNFPVFLRKTDEPNFQSISNLIEDILGYQSFVSIKYDGTSATFYHNNDQVGLCSRNLEKKIDSPSVYQFINLKYDICNKLKTYGNIAVQGEIIGPKIQKNRLGLKAPDIRVFDVFNIDTREYLNMLQLKAFCKELGLPIVEEISNGNWCLDNFEDFRKLAEVKYSNEANAEGVVVRVYRESCRISFKIINLLYKD